MDKSTLTSLTKAQLIALLRHSDRAREVLVNGLQVVMTDPNTAAAEQEWARMLLAKHDWLLRGKAHD